MKAFILSNLFLCTAFGVVLLAIIAMELRARFSGVQWVSAQNLVLMMNREAASVIDVRAHTLFQEGHILGAKNILPEAFLSDQNLQKLKNKPLVLVCATGQQTNAASGLLLKNGFKKVFGLKGGMAEYKQAGFPLQTKPR